MLDEELSVAIDCMKHTEVDVQNISYDFLEQHDGLNNREIQTALQSVWPTLASSVQSRFPDNFKTDISCNSDEQIETKNASIQPAVDFRYEKISPVRDFEERLELSGIIIEKPEDADEMERFMDGMARLGADNSDDFSRKTEALLKATMNKFGSSPFDKVEGVTRYQLLIPDPFTGCDIQTDFRYVVVSWITGKVPYRIAADHYTYIGDRLYKSSHIPVSIPATQLFSQRMKYIAEIVSKGESVQLLATPIYKHGWIDPIVFVERMIDAKLKQYIHADHDRVLALLRLTPENRDSALKLLDSKIREPDEYTQAVRYALGADSIEIGSTPCYWIAASRCRHPDEDDPRVIKAFPQLVNNEVEKTNYTISIVKHKIYSNRNKIQVVCPSTFNIPFKQLYLYPTVGLSVPVNFIQGEEPGEYPWALNVWPQNLDPVIAASLDTHSINVDNPKTDAGFRHSLAAIARPETAVHPIAISALFTGLAMKYAPVSITATDTLITIIADGRLTAGAALPVVKELTEFNLLTLRRWLKPFQTIAEQSVKHANFIKALTEHIASIIPAKELGGFLEMLNELCTQLSKPVECADCKAFLQTLSGSGKPAKLAKKLLENK